MENNNFDFLRFIFALLVVISHAYTLSGENVNNQFLYQITDGQIELSNIGLNGFFILSGFLIFKSLEKSKNLLVFFWKRFLRIFPALFIMLLITLLVLSFAYNDYILISLNRDFYTYLPRNLTLYYLQFSIKGIFENNPYPNTINGSLWSISYEFTMYILLSTLIFFRKSSKLVALLLFISFVLLFIGYNFYYDRFAGIIFYSMIGKHFFNLGAFFIGGSLLAALKFEKFESKRLLLLGVFTVLLLAVYFDFYNYVKHIVLTLFIILTGLIPIRHIDKFGRIGDMSYGIYIYGFPVQQTLMYFFKFNHIQLLIISVLISILFGYVSWHFIERKMLKFKDWNLFKQKNKIL